MTYRPSGPEEQRWLEHYKPGDFPSISLTSDVVLFTIRQGALCVLLVKRGGFPYRDYWALPGGFVNQDESAAEGARRELQEETLVDVDGIHLEQLATYSAPYRDPRMRVVSVAHVAILPDMPTPIGSDDAADAHWWAVDDLNLDDEDATEYEPAHDKPRLAFDHAKIVKDGLERVRAKFEYSTLATKFLDDTFSLSELQRIYETVWGAPIVSTENFRRKVLSTPGFVMPTDQKTVAPSGMGRPSLLYRAGGGDTLLQPAMLRSAPNRREEIAA